MREGGIFWERLSVSVRYVEVHTILCYSATDFLESRRMETAPTSIEVILRPTLDQSDEPSDSRGSLSLCDTTSLHACSSVYST